MTKTYPYNRVDSEFGFEEVEKQKVQETFLNKLLQQLLQVLVIKDIILYFALGILDKLGNLVYAFQPSSAFKMAEIQNLTIIIVFFSPFVQFLSWLLFFKNQAVLSDKDNENLQNAFSRLLKARSISDQIFSIVRYQWILLIINIKIIISWTPWCIWLVILSETKVLPFYFLYKNKGKGKVLLTKNIVEQYVSNKKQIDQNFQIMNQKEYRDETWDNLKKLDLLIKIPDSIDQTVHLQHSRDQENITIFTRIIDDNLCQQSMKAQSLMFAMFEGIPMLMIQVILSHYFQNG